MTTIKINERTKTGKAFMAMVETFFKNVEGIEIVEDKVKKEAKQEYTYSPEFIEKIKKAEEQIKQGKTTRIDTNDIWGSLGLK